MFNNSKRFGLVIPLLAVLIFMGFNYSYGKNPVKETCALTENKHRTRFLQDDERPALLTACRTSEWDKLYLLVLLALTTGARQGELLKLR